MDVINLKEHFGKVYRVIHDEAYGHEYGEHGRVEDPWLMVLPCQHGEIYPHGGDRLAAFTVKPSIGRKLAALPCCEVHQRADHVPGYGRELTVLFHLVDFPAVAAVLKPKRRRRLSPAQRAKAAQIGAAALARYRDAAGTPFRNSQRPENGPDLKPDSENDPRIPARSEGPFLCPYRRLRR